MPTDDERAARHARFEAACDADYVELSQIVEAARDGQGQPSALHPTDMTRTLAAHAGMLHCVFETLTHLQTRIAQLEWKLTQ